MALAGKHAFVTGGGRGIGRAVAAALARAGAAVTVIGRTEAPLREAVAAGEAAGCGVADVTDVVEVKRQITAAEAARGPIAILINNAGSVESGPFVRDSIKSVAAKTGRPQADVLAEYQKDAPIGRLIRPEEVAAAVVYLCSPEAAAVTGTTLAIAGGEM